MSIVTAAHLASCKLATLNHRRRVTGLRDHHDMMSSGAVLLHSTQAVWSTPSHGNMSNVSATSHWTALDSFARAQ
eukprot:2361526-Amphidinium_carterae.1